MLAGGAGTRFWPASRRALPKPFVNLVGTRTLLGDTLERLRLDAPARRTTVVSSASLARPTRAALRAHRGARLLLEPLARNTAAAIAWAAADALGRGHDGLIGVFPADHWIAKPAAFAACVRRAARVAADGECLVLLGIEPTRPDPGYGYLRVPRRADARGGLPVERFVEKPSRARARSLLASGRYLWNSGALLARPERILDETREHAPEVWNALGPELSRIAAGRAVSRARLSRAWARVTPLSFDFAVLERSRRVRAVRGSFAWSDLGSWDALGEHLSPYEGNHVHCSPEPLLLGATRNVVWSSADKQVVLIGVRDLLVIQTTDALLVCAKDRAQDVREVVGALARRHREELL